MRRRWIVVALCLAAIAVGGVLSSDYVQRRQVAKRTACLGSLNRIRLTKLLYADEHGVTNGAAIPGEVIWRENRLIERCFSGGHYSINQIYDWDRDGRNEVLYVQQAKYLDSPPADARTVRERAPRYEGDATMIVLDGRTGKEKTRFSLPAPADDSFLFNMNLYPGM